MVNAFIINSNDSISEMNSEQVYALTTISEIKDSGLNYPYSHENQPDIYIAHGNHKKIIIGKDGTYVFKMKTHTTANTPLFGERARTNLFLKINGTHPNLSTSTSSGKINSISNITNAHIFKLKAGDYVEFCSTLSSNYKDKDTVRSTNISGYTGNLADGQAVLSPTMSAFAFEIQEFEETRYETIFSPQFCILKSYTHIKKLSENNLVAFEVENSMGDNIQVDGDGLITANKDLTLQFGSHHTIIGLKSSGYSNFSDNTGQVNVYLVKLNGTKKLISNCVQSVALDGQTNSLYTGTIVKMEAGDKIEYRAYVSNNVEISSTPFISHYVKNAPHFLRCYRSKDNHMFGHFNWESTKTNEAEIVNIQNNNIISSNGALSINNDNSFSLTSNNFIGNYLLQFQLNAQVEDIDGAGLSKLEDGISGLIQSWIEFSIDSGISWIPYEQSNSSITVHKRGSQKTLETFVIGSFKDVNTRFRLTVSSHNPRGKLNTKIGTRKLIHTTNDVIPSSGTFSIVQI